MRYVFTFFFLLLSGCTEKPLLEFSTVEQRDVESTVSGVSSGTIKAEQSAELAFGAVGRVQGLYVKLGDTVKKGALLAEIENADVKLGVARAEIEFKRRETAGSNAVSASDLSAAKLAFEAARMTLERTLIKAPYDGIISELNLELGQLSQITAVIPKAPIRITDLRPRYARVDIDEVDLPRVNPGQTTRVRILAVRREPFIGSVRRVIPYVNSIREQDRTSEVEIDLQGENLLLPAGASADVEIITDKRSNVLALPSRSILGRAQSRHVFILDGDKLRRAPVTVGLINFDYTEIVSGLGRGDRVAKPSDTVSLTDGLRVRYDAERP